MPKLDIIFYRDCRGWSGNDKKCEEKVLLYRVSHLGFNDGDDQPFSYVPKDNKCLLSCGTTICKSCLQEIRTKKKGLTTADSLENIRQELNKEVCI